jgi:hypothetical protein
MNRMIASCGLICTECPAFVATQNNDEQLRIKTAEQWSKEFKADIQPESIFCDGCLQKKGRLFSHCKVCPIRKCCLEKDIPNCAYCDDYGCEHIIEFFGFVPEAKKVLDVIRVNL